MDCRTGHSFALVQAINDVWSLMDVLGVGLDLDFLDYGW